MSKVRPDKVSICLDDLKEHVKLCVNRSKNGKSYVTLVLWRNEDRNKWNQDIGVQIVGNEKNKDYKAYIGNGYRGDKEFQGQEQTPVAQPQSQKPLPSQIPDQDDYSPF